MIDATLTDIASRMREIEVERKRPLILGLDVATRCGHALGRLGETPVAGSVRFGNSSSDENVVFAAALDWASRFLQPFPRPDVVMIEALLPPDAMKGNTSKAVRDRLAGLHGVIRAVAQLRGVGKIETCSVGDVRSHFIGHRGAKRDVAKRETMRRCARLGWDCKDDNAADAAAVWSYACALIDPALALRLTPLFNKAIAL
jgi:hypothetical protein